MLTAYTWYQTDLSHALNIGLVYPVVRGILWYPYERTYKHIRRRKYKSETDRVRSNGSISQDNYMTRHNYIEDCSCIVCTRKRIDIIKIETRNEYN